MLLQKPIAKNDIVTIKLITGEEMIAGFESHDTDLVIVTKPVSLGQGPQGVGFMPWMMSAKAERIELNRRNVLAIAPTDPEIAKQYTQSTTSIQLDI